MSRTFAFSDRFFSDSDYVDKTIGAEDDCDKVYTDCEWSLCVEDCCFYLSEYEARLCEGDFVSRVTVSMMYEDVVVAIGRGDTYCDALEDFIWNYEHYSSRLGWFDFHSFLKVYTCIREKF